MTYASHLKTKRVRPKKALATPVGQPLPGRADMIRNTDGGGYVFAASNWEHLDRFLVLGSEGGTAYVGEAKHTRLNAANLKACIAADGVRVVREIERVSLGGLAPKNDPAIFALALVCAEGSPEAKAAAYQAVVKVCRTGTHLFHFCEEVGQMRGWSRGLRNAVGRWFTDKSADKLAYQVIKYRQRDGWSMKDVVKLAHPRRTDIEHSSIYAFLTEKEEIGPLPAKLEAFRTIQSGVSLQEGLQLIQAHDLPWEAVPTEWHNERALWEALLPTMKPEALLRNLSRLTALGMLDSHLAPEAQAVVAKLTDAEQLRKARLHPLKIFLGQRAYAQGQGRHLTWKPLQRVVDALDEAFIASFAGVQPVGKPTLVAIDTSGSMSMQGAMGVTAYELAAVMAYVTLMTEPNSVAVEFSTQCKEISIPRRAGPAAAIEAVWRQASRGGTNMSTVFDRLEQSKWLVDGVVIYTDNEVNQGVQVAPRLAKYRVKTGRDTRGVVAAMTATNMTVADPAESYWLNVAGFDLSVPDIIRWFIGGVPDPGLLTQDD